MKKLLYVLIILEIFSMSNCKKYSFVKGQYEIASDVDIQKIKMLNFVLIDKQNKRRIEKRVKLNQDGSFQFRTKYEGQIEIYAFISEYISSPTFQPFLSNDNYYNQNNYQLDHDSITIIRDLYISNGLMLESPMDNDRLVCDEVLFKWRKNEFADYYSLRIKKKESKLPLKIHAFVMFNNYISLNEISKFPQVNKFTVETFDSRKSFNHYYTKLDAGEYYFELSAFKISSTQKDIVLLAKSINDISFYLTDSLP